MRAIDLFGGFGGFTEGATDAGVDVVWAGNHWPTAVRVHDMNHPETIHACQDLRQTDWSAVPTYDLLLASPACQGHSTASQPRRRVYHDAMRATAWAVVDCADVTSPRAIVVENVPAFLRWGLYDVWRAALLKLGYQLDVRTLTASRHGVAQRRQRLFIIATRKGVTVPTIPESLTEPAFGPLLEDDIDDNMWMPVSGATTQVKFRVEKGRANHGRCFLTQHTTGHAGVPLSEPIRTITTAPNHWNLVDGDFYRPLTGRELARGMGFRDTFVWPEDLNLATVTKGFGNAVPPPLATAVIEVTADAITSTTRKVAA